MFQKSISKWVISSFLFLSAGQSQAGVLGDFQTFTPNTDGLYFVTVNSGSMLKEKTMVANLYLSYAKDYLLAYDSLATMKRVNYKDELISIDGTFGYSFTDSLQMFMGMTGLLYQKPDSSENTQTYLTRGVHSFRPGLKWQFSSRKDSQWALMGSVDILNVKNDPYTGEEPGPIPNVDLIWSGVGSGKGTHGFNFGYRTRSPGRTPADATFYPLKDQLTASYGYSYPWTAKTRLVFETIGCYPLDKGENAKAVDVSCLEVLGAARYRYSKNWAMVGGATVEPGIQTMAPAWRVFAGVNLYISPSADEESKPVLRNASPLVVPAYVEVNVNDFYTLPISGGEAPYKCEIVEGGNGIDLRDCAFTAPSYADTMRVRVTDRSGQEKYSEITIVPTGAAAQAPKADMSVNPPTVELLTGQTQTFEASGGLDPYRFSVVAGGGTIDPVTGYYRAPSTGPGPTRIQAEDAQGRKAYADITVRAPAKANKTFTLKQVNFIFNTTTLVPSSNKRLDEAARRLTKLNIREIIVEGHTDNIGGAEYNRDLSERRARRVAEILRQRLGLEESQVRAVGYGFDHPLVPNKDEKSRLENRRVELLIYTKK